VLKQGDYVRLGDPAQGRRPSVPSLHYSNARPAYLKTTEKLTSHISDKHGFYAACEEQKRSLQ